MYAALLWIHSWWRWVVVIATVVAWGRAWAGAFGGRSFDPGAARAVKICLRAVDFQFLIGVILYLFVSPLTALAFRDMGAAMQNPQLRFFTIEHGPSMLLVTALLHIGSARSKRGVNDLQRHRRIVTWFTVAFLLMMAAIPWPALDVGRPLLR